MMHMQYATCKTARAPKTHTRRRLADKEDNTSARRRRLTVTQRLPETWEVQGCSNEDTILNIYLWIINLLNQPAIITLLFYRQLLFFFC